MSSVAARRLAEPLKWDEPSGDPLCGLAVQLFDRCQCGSYDAVIGEGKGPHRASLFCNRCEKHRRWMANEAHVFVTEVVKKFGSQHPRSNFDASKVKESNSELGTKTIKNKQHRRIERDY